MKGQQFDVNENNEHIQSQHMYIYNLLCYMLTKFSLYKNITFYINKLPCR